MCKDCTGIKILKGEKGDTGAAGANGTNGTNGTDGSQGGWSSKWLFSTGVTSTPTSTKLQFNNANLDIANIIYINKINSASLGLGDFLNAFANNIGGTDYFGLLKIYRADSPETDFWYGKITAYSTVGSVAQVTVSMVQREGGFNANDELVVDFTPNGEKGATGATGATPTPAYKVYTALLSQGGTSAPTATVLENTIGSIVWTRASTGQYRGTLTGAFTNLKTFCLIGDSAYLNEQITITKFNANYVNVLTSIAGVATDTLLAETSVEIRVYN